MSHETPEKSKSTFQRFREWLRGHWETLPPDEDGLFKSLSTPRRYRKPGWLKRCVYFFIPGRVSRIHLYEAQERYLNLCRTLDYHARGMEHHPPTTTHTEPDTTTHTEPDTECRTSPEQRIFAIHQARAILHDAQWLLTRRQNDLNYLWRELARVQIMLIEHVVPNEKLPIQLDLCREDARRLGTIDDATVKELLERLAEATPDSAPVSNRCRMIRAIRALIERFTTIRTDRIHQQFINIRTYQKALLVLLVLSVALIANTDLVLRTPEPAVSEATQGTATATITDAPLVPAGPLGARTAAAAPTPAAAPAPAAGPWWRHLIGGVQRLLAGNVLFFVFFAGLAGGFFSVVIRLRDRGLVPGEDAYFLWYVLSKPFVGALGAMILYILMQANFVSWEMVKGLEEQLRAQHGGATVFGFGFLAGFSERVVFPRFH